MLTLAPATSTGKLENPLPSSQVIFQCEMERGGLETLRAKEGLKRTSSTLPSVVIGACYREGCPYCEPTWLHFNRKPVQWSNAAPSCTRLKHNLIKWVESSLQVLSVTWSNVRGNISDTLFSLIFLLAAFHSPLSKMADVSVGYGCLTLHSVHNWVLHTLETATQCSSPCW